MPNWDAFWGSRDHAATMRDDHNRAVDVWTLIQDNPTSVTLKRGTTVKAAQTVHATISGQGGASQGSGAAGLPGMNKIMLIGVQDHATQTDFDVAKGDKFSLWSASWTVVYVDTHTPGQIIAYCESVQ